MERKVRIRERKREVNFIVKMSLRLVLGGG